MEISLFKSICNWLLLFQLPAVQKESNQFLELKRKMLLKHVFQFQYVTHFWDTNLLAQLWWSSWQKKMLLWRTSVFHFGRVTHLWSTFTTTAFNLQKKTVDNKTIVTSRWRIKMGWKEALLLLAVVGVGAASKSFLLTGPKSLMGGTVETFCISMENDSEPLCVLDLLSNTDDVTVLSSVQLQLKGNFQSFTLEYCKNSDDYYYWLQYNSTWDSTPTWWATAV